ncbi:MAG: transglycosylase SLT domain-containing protein [Candidatus Omnitrophica bacterium]|nr:transglycosylase SLT domain-containing protein [Candidatus Omnitrophota bacterium]
MAKKKSYVDEWIKREKLHPSIREALENASRYFARTDALTVNTLEAIYGQESSFGILRRLPGIAGAVGEFHIEKKTAARYGLIVTKNNDQRFDLDYASITAARYLKDLNRFFGKVTNLGEGKVTVPVSDIVERKKFVLAAYNMGEGHIAHAQRLAQEAGKNSASWDEVKDFLEAAGVDPDVAVTGRKYVDDVLKNESEFAEKSSADKKVKNKWPGKKTGFCINGHWITKDHHHIFICG